MNLDHIFGVFSRRHSKPVRQAHPIPETSRNRILIYCRDVFGGTRFQDSENLLPQFWAEIQEALRYRHGKLFLTTSMTLQRPVEDFIRFLLSCDDAEFLDFIEYIFRVQVFSRLPVDANALVAEINQLLAIDDLGVELTNMTTETNTEEVTGYPFFGQKLKVSRVASYPQVILKDDELVHAIIMRPTLDLLSSPRFRAANSEFLAALQDYRNGDYGDVLTKACSALESVMKVLCDLKGWQYSERDTSADLVRAVIKGASLESFFEQPLILIAMMRNRFSTSHGAGTGRREPSRAHARYSLNTTAATILFLVDHVT